MFRKSAVFEEGWAPNDIRHRSSEADALAAGVRPLIEDRSPGPVLAYGESGTGKTCTTRYILDDLDLNEPSVQTAYANCWQTDSVHQVYEDIHEDVVGRTTLTRGNASTVSLFREIEDAADSQPLVLALDEADELADAQFFYRFARASNIALILVARTEASLRRSIGDERALSRLGPMTPVDFDRYSTSQMKDILWDRAEAGLEAGAIDDAQIEAIAATTENAHEAIKTLNTAAEAANANGQATITDDLIEPANDRARHLLRLRRLKYLDEHQLALYQIVTEADGKGLARSEVQSAYRERVDNPRSTDRWVRDTLSKLVGYDLICSSGETKARRYSAIDGAPDASEVQ